MNKSRSFDRAASYYDQTRPYLESIATASTQAILEIAGAGANILEVGAGTGRISIPLLESGMNLVGCDLSRKMLGRLQEKFPSARIAQADATLLPFPTNHFDTVITAHVLHLIPPWQAALREFKRVLVEGGQYLNLRTWETIGISVRDTLRTHWRGWFASHDIDAHLPGVRSKEELRNELRSMGAELTERELLRYPLQYTLEEELGRVEARIYSDAWEVPDALFDESLKDLRLWAEREYGDLNAPQEDEVGFSIDITRFS